MLPVFDVASLTTPSLAYFYHMYGADMGEMYVQISQDTGSTWSTVASHIGEVQTSSSSSWSRNVVNLPSSQFLLIRFIGVRGADFTSDMAIDELYVGEPPCDYPGMVSVDPAMSSTELTVNWEDNTGDYTVEWGVTGFTQGTPSPNMVTVNGGGTYTLTGLIPNREYDIYVYGNCASPLIVSPAVGYTLPAPRYFEDFDASFVPDDRWNEAAGVLTDSTTFTSMTSGLWASDDWLNVTSSPDNSARILVSSGTSSSSLDDWFMSPLIDLGAGGNYELTFDAAITSSSGGNPETMEADDTLFVIINTDTNTTWSRQNAIEKIHVGNQPSNSGTFYRVDLSSYSGLVRIGYHMESSVQNPVSYNMYVDNFTVREAPTCTAPIGINIADITSSSVSITWAEEASATEYIVIVTPKDSAYNSASAIADTVTGDSAYFSGLSANSEYDFYIASLCGTLPSVYNGPTAFLTNCVELVSAPYFEDFSSLPEGPAANGRFENCMTSVGAAYEWEVDSATGSNTNSSSTGPAFDNTNFPSSGGKYLYTEASSGSIGDTAQLVLPMVDIAGLSTPGLTFAYHMYGQSMGSLHVDISRDGQNWQEAYWTVSGEYHTDEDDGWDTATIDVTGLNWDTLAVRFSALRGSDFYSDISLDDIRIDNVTGCADPTQLSLTNVTANSADFSWSTTAASATIALSTSENPNDSANTVYFNAQTSSPYSFSGLDPNTCYRVYVQSACATSGEWVGGLEFCTPCLVYSAPYVESFDSTTLDGCMANYNDGSSTSIYAFWRLTTTSWPGYGASGISDNTGNGGYAIGVDASSPYTNDVRLETPDIDMTGVTNPIVSFYLYSNNTNNANNNDLIVSIYENGQWTDSIYFNNSNFGNWEFVWVDLSSYDLTQPIKIRFEVDKVSNTFYNDILIDDIYVGEGSSCSIPTALGIDTVGSDLRLYWTAGDVNNNGWVVNNTTAGTSIASSNDTIVLTGLSPNVNHCFSVQELCGVGDTSLPSNTVCASLPCAPYYNAPYSENWELVPVGDIGPGAIDNCWTLTQNGTSNPAWETEDAGGNDDNSTGTGPFYDNTNFGTAGGHYIFLETTSATSGDSATLESPKFYVGNMVNRPLLRFAYHMYGAAMGEMYVQARTSGGTWTTMDMIIGQQQTAGSDPWLIRETLLDGLGDTIEVRFIGVAGTSFTSDMALDDIELVEGPSCPEPTQLSYDNITTTTVDLSWTTYNPGATTLAEYGAPGFTPGAGTSVTLTGGTLSGLTANTCYDVYIREVCGTGDTSLYVGPVSFCTDYTCAPVATPIMPADTFVCAPNTLNLVGGTPEMYWLNGEGEVIYTGADFTTDTLNSDTALYAAAYTKAATRTFGPDTDLPGGFGNFNNGEMITVMKDLTIDTVSMVSDGARSGRINIYRPLPSFSNDYGSGNLDTMLVHLQSVDFSLSGAGEFRVPVGMALTPGQYFVNLSFDTTSTGELFRTTSASYPYALDNLISIDSAVGSGTIPLSRVYYLFNWTVSGICSSNTDSVNVEFSPEADALFTDDVSSGSATATEFTVNFDASGSENAVSYAWDFGDGNTGNGVNPTHDYLQNGTYTVELVVTGVCGDTDTSSYDITIAGISVDEFTFSGNINLFPNPTTGIVNIEVETPSYGGAELKLTSLAGRVLRTESLEDNNSWNVQWDLAELPAGVYLLQIQTLDGQTIQRIVRQ